MSADPLSPDPRLEQAGASDESIQKVHAALLQERPEPKEGYAPMPLFLLGFVSALIFICCIYVVHHRGGFDPMVHDGRFDPKLAQAAPAAAADPVETGKRLYATCMTCHQATGQGIPGVYPPLAGSDWVTGDEERLIRVLLHGLSGPIKVGDKDFNGVMPGFGPGGGYNWPDDRIAHVLTYIRQEWGNSAGAIAPEKVTEVRTKAPRTTPWTEAELSAQP